MSQSGSALRPASSASTNSPSREGLVATAPISAPPGTGPAHDDGQQRQQQERQQRQQQQQRQHQPRHQHQQQQQHGDVAREVGQVPFSDGEERAIPPRTLGVHTILNPSDSQHASAGAVVNPPGGVPIDTETKPPTTPQAQHASQPSANPQPPYYNFYSQHQTAGPPPPTPPRMGVPLPRQHGGPDRTSPTSAQPMPALHNPRIMLSPKAPRAASLNPAGMRSHEPRQPPFVTSSAIGKRHFGSESAVSSQSPPARPGLAYSGPPSALGIPPSAVGQHATQSRSLSQPAIFHRPQGGQDVPVPVPLHPPAEASSPNTWQGHYPGQQPPTPWAQHAALPQGATYTPGQSMQDQRPWGAAPVSVGRGRGTGRGASERAATLEFSYPQGNERYVVPINTQIASRAADEKRQRNAGASQRFRQRRKQQQLEDKNKLMQLEEDKRSLENRVHELESHRDHYRVEAYRLRDIVSRTPAISELAAAGPPSPPPLPSMSPQMTASMGMQLSQDYASSEKSSAEPPTRRRRTDPAPDVGSLSGPYGHQPQSQHQHQHQHQQQAPPPLPIQHHQSTLPAIHAQFGASTSRPTSASSAGDRLPPLRSLEGPGGPPGHEAGGQQSGFGSVRAPHESGWAHQPHQSRGPPEGGHR